MHVGSYRSGARRSKQWRRRTSNIRGAVREARAKVAERETFAAILGGVPVSMAWHTRLPAMGMMHSRVPPPLATMRITRPEEMAKVTKVAAAELRRTATTIAPEMPIGAIFAPAVRVRGRGLRMADAKAASMCPHERHAPELHVVAFHVHVPRFRYIAQRHSRERASRRRCFCTLRTVFCSRAHSAAFVQGLPPARAGPPTDEATIAAPVEDEGFTAVGRGGRK